MTSRLNLWRRALRPRPKSSRNIANISYLPLEIPIEEETLPYYEPQQYYPVAIGDVYHNRYQVAGKLRYGAYSTHWLCKDLHDELHDSFDLQGPIGTHQCLVLQPMYITLLEMTRLNPRPPDLPLTLLLALDFLHTDAHIIHTDLKTDNLMLSLEDSTMLANFAKEEAQNPSPRKKVDQIHTIYKTRQFRRPTEGKHYGLPVLCDFGEARIGKKQESGPFVQPHIYRAPEIIFEMPWGSSVDIWNLAGLIWDLFEGEHLFGDIFDSKGGHDPFKHLALMVALIGPTPSEFLQRSERMEQCFDSSGNWIAHKEAVIPSVSLESLERRLSGQEKKLFIQFMKSMLTWLPEKRRTAKELLADPWLL